MWMTFGFHKTALNTIQLAKHSLKRGIRARRRGPVACLPRSCDLTALNYFLYGQVKSLIYAAKHETIDALETNNRRGRNCCKKYS